MPAVIAAEENDVSVGGASCESGGDGAGFAAPFGVADHFATRNRVGEFVRQFDLEAAVHRVQAALVDLFLHGGIDDGVGVAQDDGAQCARPVDVFLPIDVDEAGAFRSLDVEGTYASGETLGATTDELNPARDSLSCAFVQFK